MCWSLAEGAGARAAIETKNLGASTIIVTKGIMGRCGARLTADILQAHMPDESLRVDELLDSAGTYVTAAVELFVALARNLHRNETLNQRLEALTGHRSTRNVWFGYDIAPRGNSPENPFACTQLYEMYQFWSYRCSTPHFLIIKLRTFLLLCIYPYYREE